MQNIFAWNSKMKLPEKVFLDQVQLAMIEGEERSRAPPPSDQVSQPIITMLKNFTCTDKHDMAMFLNLFWNLRHLYSSPVWRPNLRVGVKCFEWYSEVLCNTRMKDLYHANTYSDLNPACLGFIHRFTD